MMGGAERGGLQRRSNAGERRIGALRLRQLDHAHFLVVVLGAGMQGHGATLDRALELDPLASCTRFSNMTMVSRHPAQPSLVDLHLGKIIAWLQVVSARSMQLGPQRHESVTPGDDD